MIIAYFIIAAVLFIPLARLQYLAQVTPRSRIEALVFALLYGFGWGPVLAFAILVGAIGGLGWLISCITRWTIFYGLEER